jgi:hypothetical protein
MSESCSALMPLCFCLSTIEHAMKVAAEAKFRCTLSDKCIAQGVNDCWLNKAVLP